MTTKNKHKKEVEKLGKLEQHLIELISDIDNEILRDKFLEWQKQRLICNEIYIKFIEEMANIKTKK